MVHEKRWEQLFQLKPRKAESEIRPEHASLALAAQIVLEEILLRIVQTAQKLTGCSNLCLAGGVALNCVAMVKSFVHNYLSMSSSNLPQEMQEEH